MPEPFLAVTLLGLLNSKNVAREWRDKVWTNLALGLCALLFVILGVYQLVGAATTGFAG